MDRNSGKALLERVERQKQEGARNRALLELLNDRGLRLDLGHAAAKHGVPGLATFDPAAADWNELHETRKRVTRFMRSFNETLPDNPSETDLRIWKCADAIITAIDLEFDYRSALRSRSARPGGISAIEGLWRMNYNGYNQPDEEEHVIWRTRDGEEVRSYARGQHLAARHSGDYGLTLGGMLRAMVTGPRDDIEQRALAEGSDSAGGYTVPVALASAFIDRLRARSTVIQAGALTVELQSDKTKIARLATDPTPAWRAENAAVPESDPLFEVVTFDAQTLAVVVRVSRELLEDSLNAETMLENAFAKSLAAELDRVALFGTGTGPEPLGVINTAGIGSVSMGTNGAQFTDYSKMLDALNTLQTADVETVTAAIMHPRTFRAINGVSDTTGQPLRRPAALESLPFLISSKVPINDTQGTATNASRIVMGNFADLMIGVRTQLRIEVLKERYADALQYGFLAYLRADIQLAHPASFCEIKGIIP